MKVGLAPVLEGALNEPHREGHNIEKRGLLLSFVVVVDAMFQDKEFNDLELTLSVRDIGHGLLLNDGEIKEEEI